MPSAALGRVRRTLPALLVVVPVAALSAQNLGFWENRPMLARARQEVGAAVLGGKVYVVGGIGAERSAEVYDPATRRWSALPDLPVGTHHMAVAAAKGRLYVIGGIGAGAQNQVFDPATNRWTRAADLPVARSQMVGVTIRDQIYVVGGVVSGRGSVADLTVYDPATNRWRTLASMPTARNHLGAAALNGKLYAAGGRAGRLFANLEEYDPATNRWRQLSPMPTARGGTGAAALDGKLIVMGGEGNGARADGIFPQTEEYDPATNRWRKLRDMTPGLHGIYPVTLGDEIMVAGGATRQGLGRTNIVLAFRYLPDRVERYGRSTSACNGNIAMWVNDKPIAGNSGFSFLCSPTAPPNTAGVLAFGGHQDRTGTVLFGMRLHVGLAATFWVVGAVTNAAGAASNPTPLPPGSPGLRLFVQYVFANTPTCTGTGPLSASDALDVTLR